MVRQGTIIKINFNPQAGHEQAGYRPAVVVSNDFFNMKTNLAIVCPITNTNNHFPLHVPLDGRTTTTGVILCEHIRTLDLQFHSNIALFSVRKILNNGPKLNCFARHTRVVFIFISAT